MGKIVRGAKVVEERYVVSVPEIEPEFARRGSDFELDPRFGGDPQDELEFDDSDEAFEDPVLDGPPPEPPVDVERVRADAAALIDTAESDAEALLQHGAQRARELVERATARVAEIENEARARGVADGLAAGRASIEAELAETVASMHELVESARAARHEIIESAEPELVALAVAIAERVVHEQVTMSPSVVLENVRNALTRLIGREVVTLRVNPADLETIRQHRDAMASSSDVEHLRVVEDQRVDRGGVVIETDAGTIDAKISTQLREARRALTNGDTIAVAPQHEQAIVPAQAS